jgi:hypothetical protein
MRRFAVRSSALLSVLLCAMLVFPAVPAMAGQRASTSDGDIYVEIRWDERGRYYYIETGSEQTCAYVHIDHSLYRPPLIGQGQSTWIRRSYSFPVNQQHGGIFFINLDRLLEGEVKHHWFSAYCSSSDTGQTYWLGHVYLYTSSFGREGNVFEYPLNPPKPWWIF